MSPGDPVSGRRIVVTRPEARDGPLATAISLAGAEPVHLPLLRIDPVRFDVSTVGDLNIYDWIVFTSANGVSCFVDRLSDEAWSTFRRHPGIAVVGPSTDAAVTECGGSSSVMAPEHVAESLVRAISEVRGRRVLWPRAEAVRPVLATGLRARGADVTELIVYNTTPEVPPHAAELVQGADAVAFTSPSGVRAWAAALGRPDMRVVCIGPVTARAAAAKGFPVDAVASPYTIDGIVDALRRAFAPRAKREA